MEKKALDVLLVENIFDVLPPFENDNPKASHLKSDKLFKNSSNCG